MITIRTDPVIRRLLRPVSIWLGCRRQRIAREVRSEDVKRGTKAAATLRSRQRDGVMGGRA